MQIDFNNNTLIITLRNHDNIVPLWNTIEEVERLLCKKLSVDEDDCDEFGEIHIDVDDYYEYQAYKRLIYNFYPII